VKNPHSTSPVVICIMDLARHPHRQQPAISYSSRYAEKRQHVDSCRHQQAVISSRYIEAQIKNRMELMRLHERRQTLDRQQRDATSVIDRNKWKFAREMTDVGRTTNDLPATVPNYRYRRQRAATAGARRRITSHGNDDLDFSITPALVALQLHDRDDERSRQRRLRPNTSTGCVYSAKTMGDRPWFVASTYSAAQHRRIPSDPLRLTANSSHIAAALACQSATGRSALPRQGISVIKQIPTLSNSSLPHRSSKILQATSTTDAENHEKNTETERSPTDVDEIAAYRGRESSLSRWKRDLKREAPPALSGCRPSLNVHAILSQTERRRRLAALQSRQVAPLAARRLRTSHVKP